MKRLSGLLIYLALVGCRASTYDATYAQLNSQSRMSMQQVVETKSSLNRDNMSMFSWTVTRLPLRQKLLVAYFSDESHGWIASREGSLFKTADGGETWTKAPLNIHPGAYVRSMYFVSPDVGWIAVENPATDVLEYRKNQAWLLHTQDGGRTWNEQYADKALAIYKVLFIDEREGWATGTRYSQKQTLMTERFVLHTTDQGGHWIDVSGNLNQSIYAEEASNNHVLDMGISKSTKTIFLTQLGKS